MNKKVNWDGEVSKCQENIKARGNFSDESLKFNSL